MIKSDTEWIAPGRAALVLQVSTKTIDRMVERGELRSTLTSGGHKRVSVEDVNAVLAERAAERAS